MAQLVQSVVAGSNISFGVTFTTDGTTPRDMTAFENDDWQSHVRSQPAGPKIAEFDFAWIDAANGKANLSMPASVSGCLGDGMWTQLMDMTTGEEGFTIELDVTPSYTHA